MREKTHCLLCVPIYDKTKYIFQEAKKNEKKQKHSHTQS